jgi:hypothetical protein
MGPLTFVRGKGRRIRGSTSSPRTAQIDPLPGAGHPYQSCSCKRAVDVHNILYADLVSNWFERRWSPSQTKKRIEPMRNFDDLLPKI